MIEEEIMRNFDFDKACENLYTKEIVALLSQIHEYKGEQKLFIEAKADTLIRLEEIARIQSTDASNRIEGIRTADDRLKKIVQEKTTPTSRNEKEIAGYRDVLKTIHENHDYITPSVSYILQLHRDLYKFSGFGYGGNFKSSDNIIEETDENGNRKVRFKPVSAFETHGAIENLCNAYNNAIAKAEIDPLLLSAIFVLDFLCIHPFNDGNGRMSRLLTLLLLYRSGYIVGKYISIEKLISDSKETYYETLALSSANWHEGENDYLPFVRYMLGVVVAAYKDFSQRVKTIVASGLSKPERIKLVIKENIGKITKSEILEKCPDISQVTVQRTLTELVEKGEIIKIGGGRYTSYVWNQDN